MTPPGQSMSNQAVRNQALAYGAHGANLASLRAAVVPVSALTADDFLRVAQLMRKYYDEVSDEQVKSDLLKKSAVILLRDRRYGAIQGFSTLLNVDLQVNGKRIVGVFSGDTIIEKAYWGQKTLGKAFLKYLWLQKVKNPFRAYYWFLISKGYKTYLLMANNYAEHYPRHEQATPASKKAIMDAFYSSLYPRNYDPASGLIRFEGPACKLKSGVADMDPELVRTLPRVDFFQKTNPGWAAGDELACIAKMTLLMPLKYQLKALFKKRSGRVSASGNATAHARELT